ncbi:MAG: hypothetical protein ABI768_01970 [Acidobacteriota bacterium]
MARPLRAALPAAVSLVFLLEGGCGTWAPPSASSGPGAQAPPSSPFKEIPSSTLAAYESARIKAWDPSRRFKALFKAEVSPKVGAIGRGYLSVWWDGASGSLEWRASAPIAGRGRGGLLRKGRGEGGADPDSSPLPGRLSSSDLIACILGTPDAPPSPSSVLDDRGNVVQVRFPNGEVVTFQPGSGVPRRIEANGPDGRAVLTLESYGPWPAGEEVPPP